MPGLLIQSSLYKEQGGLGIVPMTVSNGDVDFCKFNPGPETRHANLVKSGCRAVRRTSRSHYWMESSVMVTGSGEAVTEPVQKDILGTGRATDLSLRTGSVNVAWRV